MHRGTLALYHLCGTFYVPDRYLTIGSRDTFFTLFPQVVTHGGTLTSTVTFKECVKAVSRHGFHASPYPVILTIENHVKQQQVGLAASSCQLEHAASCCQNEQQQLLPTQLQLASQVSRSLSASVWLGPNPAAAVV